VRNLLAVLPILTAFLSSIVLAAAEPDFDVQALGASVSDPAPEEVVAGSLDSRFGAFNYRDARRRGGPFWLKLRSTDDRMPAGAFPRSRSTRADTCGYSCSRFAPV